MWALNMAKRHSHGRAENRYEGILRIFLKRNNFRFPLPDNRYQTPLSLASRGDMMQLPGSYRNGKILILKNSISGQESPPLCSKCAAVMETRSHDPNTNTTDFNGQPALLLPGSDEQKSSIGPQELHSRAPR